MSCKNIRGSLTVEASFSFPLFFFCIIFFLSIIQIVNIQEQVQNGINEVAEKASSYAHIYDTIREDSEDDKKLSGGLQTIINSLISGAFYKNEFEKYVDQGILSSYWVENGVEGVNFTSSEFLNDSDYIYVVATYTLKLPFLFQKEYDIKQQVRVRGFLGRSYLEYESDDSEDNYVYITKTGTVYHKSKGCTHLDLSIKEVSIGQLDDMRNKSGGKYYACERCCKKLQNISNVYITNFGDCYHCSLDCPGLTRVIRRVKLEDVGERTPCKKCYGLE